MPISYLQRYDLQQTFAILNPISELLQTKIIEHQPQKNCQTPHSNHRHLRRLQLSMKSVVSRGI